MFDAKTPFIQFGTATMEVEPEDLVTRPRGLDTVMQVWQTPSENTFREGGPIPRRPHMRIKEVSTRREGPVWVHRVTGEGLAKPGMKFESLRIRQPEEGFDEGPVSLLTTQPDMYVQGTALPGYPSLIFLETDKDDLNGYVWRVEGTCKGILGSKAVKRKYSVNGKEIKSSASFLVPGVAGEPRQWSMPRARIVMTERYLANSLPPTEMIGVQLAGGEIPADAPTLSSYPVDFYAAVSWNYPYNWRVLNVTGERLLEGRLEHDITVTYEFVPINEVEPA